MQKKMVDGKLIDLTPEEIAALTPTLEAAKEQKLAALAAKRFEVETGGTTLNGIPVATDRESVAIITAAYVAAKEDPEYAIRWKAAQGVFVTLDAQTIIATAHAARAHVQTCFDREADLTEAILAAETVEALDAIDINAGWPA